MTSLETPANGDAKKLEPTETQVSYAGKHPLIWGRSSALPLDIAQELNDVFALVRVVHQLTVNKAENNSSFDDDAEEALSAATALLRDRTHKFETKFKMI